MQGELAHPVKPIPTSSVSTPAKGKDTTDSKKQEANENPDRSSAPSHVAYHVCEISENKNIWTRIGSAWEHGDTNGFNIQLDMSPMDGRITLRRPEERRESRDPVSTRKAAEPRFAGFEP
jgi:hypothetical protein